MQTVEDREAIRRAFFIEEKSIREIARELHHSRRTIRKALATAEAETYTVTEPRPAPVLGPYKARIDELLGENVTLPRKQRYTGERICAILEDEGYAGSRSTVRTYIAGQRKAQRKPKVYLPLEFDPGTDAQVDWGEGVVEIAGERVTVQLFTMRLSYSRRMFMMAFPTQRQEAFLMGHVHAFVFFSGVPHRISYDNLKTAVLEILTGHNRREQTAFVALRSHYLYESYFCTPGQGHEKGGVEHGVGLGRRNYLVPIPQVRDFAELNAHLLACCVADDARRVDRQPQTIGEAWEAERAHLKLLPAYAFDPRITQAVTLNPYSQVTFETNRYSVPVEQAQKQLVVKADPFTVTIQYLDKVLSTHPRSYGREQDILDPLHYLPLLEQRPGAFEHAKPLRQWRTQWPPVYERLLATLRKQDESGGVREFLQVLKLHREYPARQIEQAVAQALEYGCAHANGVRLCLHQLQHPETPPTPLDLTRLPKLAAVAQQPPDVRRYEQLLTGDAE
jgi:transposase